LFGGLSATPQNIQPTEEKGPLSSAIYCFELGLLGPQKKKKNITSGNKDSYFLEMKKLLFSKENSDIIFDVEGHKIPAHRSLLSVRSNYFHKIFNNEALESQMTTIKIPNIKVDTFKAILEFLYYNEPTLNDDLARDLIPVCDEYSLDELKNLCGSYLSDITRDNFAANVEFAEKFKMLGYFKLIMVGFLCANMLILFLAVILENYLWLYQLFLEALHIMMFISIGWTFRLRDVNIYYRIPDSDDDPSYYHEDENGIRRSSRPGTPTRINVVELPTIVSENPATNA